MKPDEEMHAAVEEVDLDPCDLYTDLGTLIVEGRVPGLNDRGFGEGLHCPGTHGQNRHQCDPSSIECQKYEQILKHMLLLWKNSIPMTIEVLLYPKCCISFPIVDSVPETPYILLEQWTIHMLPKRVPDANISPRGLIQAVRSFLYFSQLCAWYSLTGGKSPENVHYRVCVPGEAFSSKFSSQPDCHLFPVANVGRSTAMKVLVKCYPRCGGIPSVPCYKHAGPSLPMRKGQIESPSKLSEADIIKEYMSDGIAPSGITPRTSSPADSMLGESLLDPPNSLCMYQKRYQSPSRCGSPSIEVPEHLMFGKTTIKKEEKPCRSRPQRRPVVERFLKKNMVDDLCNVPEATKPRIYNRKTLQMLEKQTEPASHPEDVLRGENIINFCCIEDYMKHVPREEMEHVLECLRDEKESRKCPHRTNHNNSLLINSKGPPHKMLSEYIKEMTLAPEAYHKNAFYKISSDELKICDTTPKTISFAEKIPPSMDICRLQSPGQKQKPNLLPNKFKLIQSDRNSPHPFKGKGNASAIKSPTVEQAYQGDRYWNSLNGTEPQSKPSAVNIKKLGAFIPKCEQLEDERMVIGRDGKKKAIKDSHQRKEVSPVSHEVPSAEKKAMFRRSLDSATSLVFHQRSGLPLTSSPAPIRKCGTCFDFDSTLTSVSAIKRALFDKEPEEESADQDNNHLLSTSAPASIFSSSLLGTFEESVLNGRLDPVSTVEGFTAEIGASGSFCPRHIKLPVTVFFYTLHDMDKVTSPYMGHINLKAKDYHIPKKGTVQVTLFNPHGTVVKMFVVRYDLWDMPINCQTFLRQRTLYMPSDAGEGDPDAQKWLRYLIHLRFMSSKSGRIYLHTDIRVIIFRKSDLDAATVHGQRPYELRTFTHEPQNPKFSPHKP